MRLRRGGRAWRGDRPGRPAGGDTPSSRSSSAMASGYSRAWETDAPISSPSARSPHRASRTSSSASAERTRLSWSGPASPRPPPQQPRPPSRPSAAGRGARCSGTRCTPGYAGAIPSTAEDLGLSTPVLERARAKKHWLVLAPGTCLRLNQSPNEATTPQPTGCEQRSQGCPGRSARAWLGPCP
jgi:hypothetical protein